MQLVLVVTADHKMLNGTYCNQKMLLLHIDIYINFVLLHNGSIKSSFFALRIELAIFTYNCCRFAWNTDNVDRLDMSI